MTRTEYFRFRTGSSGLTDDELVHFDWFAKMAMFGCWSRPIVAEDAAVHMNLAFPPHTMKDEALKAHMEQWHTEGLFKKELDEYDGHFMYYLTPAGGAHWAAERLPVWERYYSTTWDLGERFVITAPDRKIASHYLRSAIKCRYLRPRKRHSTYRLRDWPPEEFPPFPWPRFRRAWQLQLRVKRDNGYLSTNWECLEKERTGWSDPVELISLRLNGTPPWPETL